MLIKLLYPSPRTCPDHALLVHLGENNPSASDLEWTAHIYVHLNGLAIVRLKYSTNSRMRRCKSSTEVKLPRLRASSASSVVLQCVTGLPDSWEGASQAIATIWQTCSALKVGGAPLRARSQSVCSIAWRNSFSPASCATPRRSSFSSHTPRHRREASRFLPSRSAICSLLAPSAAARTMRARRASL